jgi:hypothetical protein
MSVRTEITRTVIGTPVITVAELRVLVAQITDAPDNTPVRVRDNGDRSPGNRQCTIEVKYEVES